MLPRLSSSISFTYIYGPLIYSQETKMSSSLPRRILKETQRLMSEPVPGINASPDEANHRYFRVVIDGPQESPYAGGSFHLEL